MKASPRFWTTEFNFHRFTVRSQPQGGWSVYHVNLREKESRLTFGPTILFPILFDMCCFWVRAPFRSLFIYYDNNFMVDMSNTRIRATSIPLSCLIHEADRHIIENNRPSEQCNHLNPTLIIACRKIPRLA
jgi:hypothetical protein